MRKLMKYVMMGLSGITMASMSYGAADNQTPLRISDEPYWKRNTVWSGDSMEAIMQYNRMLYGKRAESANTSATYRSELGMSIYAANCKDRREAAAEGLPNQHTEVRKVINDTLLRIGIVGSTVDIARRIVMDAILDCREANESGSRYLADLRDLRMQLESEGAGRNMQLERIADEAAQQRNILRNILNGPERGTANTRLTLLIMTLTGVIGADKRAGKTTQMMIATEAFIRSLEREGIKDTAYAKLVAIQLALKELTMGSNSKNYKFMRTDYSLMKTLEAQLMEQYWTESLPGG